MRLVFVIGEDNFFSVPDAAYCKTLKQNLGATFDVVYDTEDAHLAYGRRDASVVVGSDGVITFKSSYGDSHAEIWGAVDDALGN